MLQEGLYLYVTWSATMQRESCSNNHTKHNSFPFFTISCIQQNCCLKNDISRKKEKTCKKLSLLSLRNQNINEDEFKYKNTGIPRFVRTSNSALSISAQKQIVTTPRIVRIINSISAHVSQLKCYNFVVI